MGVYYDPGSVPLTEVHVEFGDAHCLAGLREEAPESVVGGLRLRLHICGRHGLGQGIFRCAQFESCTGTVDGRHAAGSVHVASTASGDGSRREARGLRGSGHREMERGCQVGRWQFGHKAPILGQTGNGRPMHGGALSLQEAELALSFFRDRSGRSRARLAATRSRSSL